MKVKITRTNFEEVGARSFEDLDFHLEHTVLAAQRHKLGAFIARQPGPAAVIDSSLRDPVAKTAVRDPQITGDLRDRLLTQPSKLDSTTPDLREQSTPTFLLAPTVSTKKLERQESERSTRMTMGICMSCRCTRKRHTRCPYRLTVSHARR